MLPIQVSILFNGTNLPAIALEPAAIQTKAAKFIVKIGGDRGGTGFFVRKSNNRYTILTNRHVVENPADRIVTTSDGRQYNFSNTNLRSLPGLDLAEIEIESEVNYPVATLSNKSTISPGSLVYTYGWNAVGTKLKSRGLQWLDGKVTGQLPTYNSSDGYSLGYTLALIRGLSGSPLLNEDGEVIGIYGSGEENSIGLGIPIATYRNRAAISSSNSSTPAPIETTSSASKISPGLPRLNGAATIEMNILNRGQITIQIDGNIAPITADNFVDLVQKGFYNGLTFHRVIRDPAPFVAQGGDPRGNGTGGYIPTGASSERRIPLEIKPKGANVPIYSQVITDVPQLQHRRGNIAMARSQSPDSASSQFYFTLADVPFLDGNYAVFGEITNGLDIIDTIQKGDIISSVRVIQGLENLKK
jgi:peptidyl-prolyl cis-trans isomerase B (cyclophilin B)